MDRREFLKKSLQVGTAAWAFINAGPDILLAETSNKNLIVVKNGSPREMVNKAIELLGGISKFVKKGDTVVIKPNIGWARRPEQAANTNPEIVAEIIRLCKLANASKIKVFDNTCNEMKRCYQMSGIESAAKAEGGDVSYIYPQKFKEVQIPQGKILKSWEFYSDALEADVFINVPIAKHHSLCQVTMGLKNIMGILGGNRGKIHNQFDRKIVDLNTVIRPHLTILDAVRILMRNGPQGGNLADVKNMNTIVAGQDPVAIDSFGASLFGFQGNQLGYIREAYDAGLGEVDLKKMKVKEYSFSI